MEAEPTRRIYTLGSGGTRRSLTTTATSQPHSGGAEDASVIADLKKIVEELESELVDKQQEINTLQEELDGGREGEEIEELKGLLEERDEQIEQMDTILRELEGGDTNSLHARLRKQEVGIKGLEAENNELRRQTEELSVACGETDKLKERVQELEEVVETLEHTIQELVDSKSETEAEKLNHIKHLMDSLESVTQEADSLRGKVAKQDTLIDGQARMIEKLQADQACKAEEVRALKMDTVNSSRSLTLRATSEDDHPPIAITSGRSLQHPSRSGSRERPRTPNRAGSMGGELVAFGEHPETRHANRHDTISSQRSLPARTVRRTTTPTNPTTERRVSRTLHQDRDPPSDTSPTENDYASSSNNGSGSRGGGRSQTQVEKRLAELEKALGLKEGERVDPNRTYTYGGNSSRSTRSPLSVDREEANNTRMFKPVSRDKSPGRTPPSPAAGKDRSFRGAPSMSGTKKRTTAPSSSKPYTLQPSSPSPNVSTSTRRQSGVAGSRYRSSSAGGGGATGGKTPPGTTRSTALVRRAPR